MEDAQQVGTKIIETSRLGKCTLKQARLTYAHVCFNRPVTFRNRFHIIEHMANITLEIRFLR